MLLLPMLAGGGGALAGLVQDWAPVPAPRAKAQPVKSAGCCGAMAKAMAAGMAQGMEAAGCACPKDAPCRVEAAPVSPGQSALLAAPAWPEAPAITLASLEQAGAQPTSHPDAPRRTPDPPPQARYLRLAVLRI